MTVEEISTEHTQSPFSGGIYCVCHSANSRIFREKNILCRVE